MSHHRKDAAEPTPISRPLVHCPECGSTRLEPVVESLAEEVHFLCLDCARCWDVSFGTVRRVAPLSCLGCAARERCERTYAIDHPEFEDHRVTGRA